MATTVFIERVSDLPNGKISARLAQPVKASTGEFVCHWQIVWPGHEDTVRSAERTGCRR